MRNITFTDNGWNDFLYWSKSDRKIFDKLTKLIEEISRDPFTGTGKPEALKHQFKGFWSRRITDEHRLVYSASNTEIKIISCLYHYK